MLVSYVGAVIRVQHQALPTTFLSGQRQLTHYQRTSEVSTTPLGLYSLKPGKEHLLNMH